MLHIPINLDIKVLVEKVVASALCNDETAILLHTGNTGRDCYDTRYDFLAGLGCLKNYTIDFEIDASEIDAFLKVNSRQFVFAHLQYDLKGIFERDCASKKENPFSFSPGRFFVPAIVAGKDSKGHFYLDQKTGFQTRDEAAICQLLSGTAAPVSAVTKSAIDFTETGDISTFYRQQAEQIRHHLSRGDIYEMNFCLPFSARGKIDDPVKLWLSMQKRQQAPFACLYKENASWLLCTSPERYLKKSGNSVVSQPMKGTAPRGANAEEDFQLENTLRNSEKERAENVMIVDLVRNDLGRIAETGSVKVDECFGVYKFPTVHQMVSTVSARLKESIGFSAILKATFPMGSMTGAPKIRAMQLIEAYENFSRGLYSGSVGYIDPQGDFDFNVVIRSILYNEQSGYIQFPAGSAFTMLSDTDEELSECLLKAKGMLDILQKTT